MTKLEMIKHIDRAADAARLRLVEDPLRTFEYFIAETEAKQFQAANFQGEAPPTVKSWANAIKVSYEEACLDILLKASEWRQALYYLRDVRLNGKHQIEDLSDEDAVIAYEQIIQRLKVF